MRTRPSTNLYRPINTNISERNYLRLADSLSVGPKPARSVPNIIICTYIDIMKRSVGHLYR